MSQIFFTADSWEFKILDSVWIFQLVSQGQSLGPLTKTPIATEDLSWICSHGHTYQSIYLL